MYFINTTMGKSDSDLFAEISQFGSAAWQTFSRSLIDWILGLAWIESFVWMGISVCAESFLEPVNVFENLRHKGKC